VTPSADDHRIAAEIAEATGVMLVQLRAELVSAGVASWRVMDEGDMQAHHFIVERLGALRPGDAILSEEGRDGPARLSADRVWVVDPLDGTNEFGQPGRSDWAVHIALAVRGEPVVGAVALPAIGVVYGTGDPPPYPPPIEGRRLRVITSRSRSSHAAAVVAHSLDADIVTLGSAGAKAMAIVAGDADIYAHSGGQYEWDNAAPAAVAISAGLHVSRLDGSPLVYNQRDPWLPDLLICRPELAGPALDALWS
jgi:3'(2'), 5'-bisphosphate nucleotidase